jgi:hypothetical protein
MNSRAFLKLMVGEIVIVDRFETEKTFPFRETFVEKEIVLADAGERQQSRVQDVVLLSAETILRGVRFVGGRGGDAEQFLEQDAVETNVVFVGNLDAVTLAFLLRPTEIFRAHPHDGAAKLGRPA